MGSVFASLLLGNFIGAAPRRRAAVVDALDRARVAQADLAAIVARLERLRRARASDG